MVEHNLYLEDNLKYYDFEDYPVLHNDHVLVRELSAASQSVLDMDIPFLD